MSRTSVQRSTGPRSRPAYDRDSVLQVAVTVFNERGYDGTSMEELAKRLGLSKSSIYHHVSGKDELLDLAVGRALDALFAALDDEDRSPALTATARLEHIVHRSVEVLVAELPFVTLLLRVRGNSAVEQRALERRRELDHRVAELVARAAAEGGVRSDIDPHLASRLLFGTVNSLIEWYRPEGGLPAAALADALTAVVFDGLRDRSPR
ncbi:TetR/AcrR family transcriptional regulator [Streptomyces sp. NPDC058274]|uniref:TetR/AcrR family transcriptional regulator n=1 Tax=Streptomyces sp. NPDC058274 TaxID=3346416 RepID=UPI0036DFB34F